MVGGDDQGLDERQRRLKELFIKERGYWSEELWGEILKLDPDFFEAYLNFSAKPWRKGVLPPKVKEFIYMAVNATRLFAPGLRLHIRNALKHGATVDEILEVLEITSVMGIHGVLMGIPILVEEVRNKESKESKET